MSVEAERDESSEQTALLGQDAQVKPKPSPLPRVQLGVLMLFMLCEPISSQCIYPFINELVASLPITGGDEAKVGYYAGLIQSLFFATEAVFVFHWSRLSDQVGRKPVLLFGVLGLAVSMILFGLSRTFLTLVLSRCLNGLANGNTGVIKSMVGEITDPTNAPQAFATIPMTWAIGAAVGPLIGGTLSRPYDLWSRVFSNPFWRRYPYFLPCLVSGLSCVVTFVIAGLFLEETLKRRPASSKPQPSPPSITEEGESVGAALSPGETLSASEDTLDLEESTSVRALLTRQVIVSIGNYGFLAILDSAFMALQPLFYSTPVELGGLGLSPRVIGLIMASYGIAHGLFQVLFFARIVHRFGTKAIFCAGISMFMGIFALFPIVAYLARSYPSGPAGLDLRVWAAVALQLCMSLFMECSYGTIYIFITNAAPSRRMLGSTNGLAQTTASIVRAIGPATSTSLFAWSNSKDVLGGNMVYIVLFILSMLSMLVTAQLPASPWQPTK